MRTASTTSFVRISRLTALLLLPCSAAWALAPVTGVATYNAASLTAETLTNVQDANSSARYTVMYNGAVRRLSSLQTSAGSYGLMRGLHDVQVWRNTAGIDAGYEQRVNLHIETEITSTAGNILRQNGPSLRDAESALRTGAINVGTDNTFVNTFTNNTGQQRSSIERIDVLFRPLAVANAAQLSNIVTPVFDRGVGDNFRIAAITGDATCTNTTVGAQRAQSTWGTDINTNHSTGQWQLLVRNPPGDAEMRPAGRFPQGVAGQVFNLADLGVTVGQTFCGIALFGADSTGNDPSNRTQNPPTPENPNGLDLMAAFGLFELGATPTLNPPVATDDPPVTTHAPGTAATVNVLGNDSDPDDNIAPASVVFVNPPTGATLSADGKSLTVPNEGTWAVSATGVMTFTPLASFTDSPTPVQYTVTDDTGLTSNPATVTLLYGTAPTATDDANTMTAGQPITLNVLENDTAGTAPLDATSVSLTNPPAGSTLSPDGKTLTVPGEGRWTVDTTTGAITFTPDPGFTGTPNPVGYTVADTGGRRSAAATITIGVRVTPAEPVPVPTLGTWGLSALALMLGVLGARRRRR